MKNNNPLVSVIIPCYNQGEYIEECLNSVFVQTYKNIEIIVVNDGSTDKYTIKKINEIKKKYKEVLVFNIKNSGLSGARNYGIKNSSGEFILPLDADDYIHLEYIEKAVEAILKDENIGIVYCDDKRFGEVNKVVIKPDFNKDLLLVKNYIRACALFRKKDWEKVGGYDSEMVYGWEEWNFWLSIIELGRIGFKLDGVYFYYRIKKKSMARSMRDEYFKKTFMHLKVMLNHPDLYKDCISFYEDYQINNLFNYYRIEYENNEIVKKTENEVEILNQNKTDKYLKVLNLNYKNQKIVINNKNSKKIRFYPLNKSLLLKVESVLINGVKKNISYLKDN
ncbi:MAG: glycosyltransferase family A protein, partial [Candidatus Muiribacteriota bacterium]